MFEELGPIFSAVSDTDLIAIQTAAHLIQLHGYVDGDEVLRAFHDVVMCMQVPARELAYHAIARESDWESRGEIWMRAGLEGALEGRALRRCKNEP